MLVTITGQRFLPLFLPSLTRAPVHSLGSSYAAGMERERERTAGDRKYRPLSLSLSLDCAVTSSFSSFLLSFSLPLVSRLASQLLTGFSVSDGEINGKERQGKARKAQEERGSERANFDDWGRLCSLMPLSPHDPAFYRLIAGELCGSSSRGTQAREREREGKKRMRKKRREAKKHAGHQRVTFRLRACLSACTGLRACVCEPASEGRM